MPHLQIKSDPSLITLIYQPLVVNLSANRDRATEGLPLVPGICNSSISASRYSYLSGENEHLSIDDNGYIRVRTPGISFSEEDYVGQTLAENGIVPALQILREINQSSQFIDCFKHLSPKHHKLKPGTETILAGILGKGCNIGIDKLS